MTCSQLLEKTGLKQESGWLLEPDKYIIATGKGPVASGQTCSPEGQGEWNSLLDSMAPEAPLQTTSGSFFSASPLGLSALEAGVPQAEA